MKASVIVFPGSNCDRDVRGALVAAGAEVEMVWHGGHDLPESDLVVVPGGFSYGDYLRSGAMAAHSPVMREVKQHTEKGGYVLGICNGFQVLTEAGLLPGALMRNRDLKFICRDVMLKPGNTDTAFTKAYVGEAVVRIPIAHHDGNYQCDAETLKALNDNEQIAFTYQGDNPNGSVADIAGIFSKNKRVLGMMPHPERAVDPDTGGVDGKALFESLLNSL